MSGVISIRKYLEIDPHDREQVLLHALRLLLDGISRHAVPGEPREYQRFQAELDEIGDRITADTPAPDLLPMAGSALRILEAYNRRAGAFLRFQTCELQAMVAMLTETLTTLGAGQQRTIGRLQEIEYSIEKASKVDDLRLLKVSLSECLATFREETLRQQAESARLLRDVQQGVADADAKAAAKSVELDPVTGLLTRPDGERALASAIREGSECCVAAFVVERVHIVNARFGYDVGNRMLAEFQRSLLESLPEESDLFRWSGPAFVMLLERQAPLDFVRSQIARICAKKLEIDADIGSRSLLLPVSAAFTVMPLQPSVKLLAHKIDAFIASCFREKG